jgi:hypothetical protein
MVAVLTTFFSGLGLGATAAGIAANITGSVILSLAQRALVGRPKLVDPGADIQVDTSLPAVRFAYGTARIPGTWVPGAEIAAPYLYGFYLLNSRPSQSIDAILLDDVPLTWSGDPRDWATGATATNSQHAGFVKFWVTLGDRIGAPDQIMAEYGDATGTNPARFWPSDRFEGLTGIWFRLERGPAGSVQSRWPSGRPAVLAQGNWSRVWDPRDLDQDPDDPGTWAWSDNHGLCVLDFLRLNPVTQYPLTAIRLDGGLGRQIALSDELVDGEPRYRVGGVIDFGIEKDIAALRPQIEKPGGGWFVDVGGQVDYRPGEYLEPEVTLTVPLADQDIAFECWGDLSTLPRGIRAEFPNPGQNWEATSLAPAEVPGGGGLDGSDDRIRPLPLPMVPFPRQAMRLQKIEAQIAGAQRRLSLMAPPPFAPLVAGATFDAVFPRATDRRAGEYMIARMRAAHSLDSPEGTVLAVPVEGVETGPHIWAWNLATDGQEVGTVTTDVSVSAMAAPTDLIANPVVSGTSVLVQFSFLPSTSPNVSFYLWEWSTDGVSYTQGGSFGLTLDSAGRIVGEWFGAPPGTTVSLRVKAAAVGRESAWLTLTGISTPGAVVVIDGGVY